MHNYGLVLLEVINEFELADQLLLPKLH